MFRSVSTFFTGLFLLTGLMLVAVPLIGELSALVESNAAVQALGWDSMVPTYRTVIFRWAPALWIIYLLTWGTAWALRRDSAGRVRR